MKKKIIALLCVLALCIPALSMAYTCDSCDYEGSFNEVVIGEEVRNGAPGVWYATVCPNCGASSPAIPPSWRQTGPAAADPPPQTGNTNPDPPKTDPEPEIPEEKTDPEDNPPQDPGPPAQAGSGEQPVTVQPEEPVILPSVPQEAPAGSGGTQNTAPAQPEQPAAQAPAGSGETQNAVQAVPDQSAPQPDTAQTAPVSGPDPADSQPQTAAEPLPPVPEENPAPEQPAPQPGEAPEPDSGDDKPDPASQANTYVRNRRNLKKYPIFSASRPSRRLNLEGDPDAWAPIPGEKIYPPVPEEGSSFLRHMLDGE